MTRRAVFIDRDGTLNEEVGYMNHAARFRLLPGAAEAVLRLNAAGVAAVVVTNQAGVARGYFPEDRIHEVHKRMEELLAAEGARLDGVYYCAHHPEVGAPPYRRKCDCRKPRPGLILQAAADLDLDVERSYVVGDRDTDIELAKRAGTKMVFVKTGYGLGEWEYNRNAWKNQPDYVAEDLLDAVEWILEDMGSGE
jgi:D-glycero-D-manno-heptose 1,7-bisphosphate phosphatase